MDGDRCSVLAADEPLAGTAAQAASWLCVEQPGPWGRDTPVDSHLDEGVARGLVDLARGTGVRLALIRRPGSHPDRHHPTTRHVYLAHTAPGRTWLEHREVADPKELLDLDLARAGAGEPGELGDPVSDPLLLVCTNGRRDVCCALRGRPIAAALAAERGEQVWECTHLGGHRFAPTAVLLPTGYAYGRLTVPAARRLLTDGPTTADCRGRSTWSPPGQVAELTVRDRAGVTDLDALRVSAVADTPAGWLATVSHVDGRSWRVDLERRTGGARAASCGAASKPVVAIAAVGLHADSRPPAQR